MAEFVTQPVDRNYQYSSEKTKVFSMIDNYVYLYHTDTLIVIPTYPESIDDQTSVTFNKSTPLARSAPIYSYAASGPRTFNVKLDLHRELMNEINTSNSSLRGAVPSIESVDYVDMMVNQLRAAALPRYASAEKMVNPPVVAVRFGKDIFCKGVVDGGVGVVYSGPILRTDVYAVVEVSFSISEIDPYDADSVMTVGGYRSLNTTLERRVWSASGSSSTFNNSGISTSPASSTAKYSPKGAVSFI